MIKIGTIILYRDRGFNKTIYGVIIDIDSELNIYKIRLIISQLTHHLNISLSHSEWWIDKDDIITTE